MRERLSVACSATAQMFALIYCDLRSRPLVSVQTERKNGKLIRGQSRMPWGSSELFRPLGLLGSVLSVQKADRQKGNTRTG